MLSIIIQEHNETKEFVKKMLNQASLLPQDKEVIYVTSMSYDDFYSKYGPFNYRFPIKIIGDVHSCGAARNVGGILASGDDLLYMDSHVCFNPNSVTRVLDTLNTHSDSIVAPAIKPMEFPSCTASNISVQGHGVAFRFTDKTFEWVWLPSERLDQEFKSPFVCGCAFSMKKDVFNILKEHGGFLSDHTGLSWEEEKSMRLWRLGHPTFTEPRAIFGHYFKGYPGHRSWDDHSTKGYYLGRIIGLYINVFDDEVWNHVNLMLSKQWKEEWDKGLKYAQANYLWLRKLMEPYAKEIDEKWFIRIK